MSAQEMFIDLLDNGISWEMDGQMNPVILEERIEITIPPEVLEAIKKSK